MSNLFARSIAKLVGAPTPIKIPIFAINAFCTSSKLSLPEHVKNWLEGFNNFLLRIKPINLSKALCLPTSSFIAITFPLSENNPLA